ncbi:MAG: ankyrin repeat domain-containing protein [Nitrospirota bacterium]
MPLFLSGCLFSLLTAAGSGDTKAVLDALGEGTDVNAAVPLVGTRALTLAAAHGHLDTVRALLDKGADVNASDLTGWTPLHAAAYKGDPEVIQLLVEKGALVSASNWYTPTPLAVAESLEHGPAVETLKKLAPSGAPAASVPN